MNSMRNDREKKVSDFTRTQMKKDTILRELRKRGGRITKQRDTAGYYFGRYMFVLQRDSLLTVFLRQSSALKIHCVRRVQKW